MEIKTSHFSTAYSDPPIASTLWVGQSGPLRDHLFLLPTFRRFRNNPKRKSFENQQMPHIWPPFVTRRIDIVLFFFFFLETEEEMTCILFVVGPGVIYSRPVLKIFLLLLLLHLARTYGCTLLGENLFSSATCARRHVFLVCLLALFCSSTHCWLAGWLSDKWKRLTHPDFTAVPSGPPVGVRGNRGNGLRSVSSSFFFSLSGR